MGASTDPAPEQLGAAILFAPVGALALKALRKGGRVVRAGIHMSDIPAFPYAGLWEERQILSVANLTRQDGSEFLALAAKVPVRTSVTTLPLSQARLSPAGSRLPGRLLARVGQLGIERHRLFGQRADGMDGPRTAG